MGYVITPNALDTQPVKTHGRVLANYFLIFLAIIPFLLLAFFGLNLVIAIILVVTYGIILAEGSYRVQINLAEVGSFTVQAIFGREKISPA